MKPETIDIVFKAKLLLLLIKKFVSIIINKIIIKYELIGV